MAMKGSVTTWFMWLIRWKDSTWEDRRCRLTSKPSRRSGSWRCGTFWRHKCNKCNKCNKCDKCDKCDNEKKNFVQPRECAPLVNTKRYLTQSWIIFNLIYVVLIFFRSWILQAIGVNESLLDRQVRASGSGRSQPSAFGLRPTGPSFWRLKHGWNIWLNMDELHGCEKDG